MSRAKAGGFALVLLLLAACAHEARLPVSAGVGPDPALPPPPGTLLPTVSIAPAEGWPKDRAPVPAEGLKVERFAEGLAHPRWLYVLPNGDVLVAETNRPAGTGPGGLKGWAMGKMMKAAGAADPSANRITLLRDTDGDGRADFRSAFLENLNSPFGMALVGEDFYVANTDAIVRFPYKEGVEKITDQGTPVLPLPAGPLNYHWTKNLVASPDGRTLYVTVGSNSNIAEYGLEREEGRAAVWALELASGKARIVASGLRNPVGMAWQPQARELWVSVNERDLLGSDLVPDYMTRVREGGFYGWPWSYFGAHVDERVEPRRPELVAKAIVPDYALGPHTSSLGLSNAEGARLGPRFAQGMFVGQHGSWNREPLSGYKVLFVPFDRGRPSGMPIDVLTGFVAEDGKALGRPVGVAIDRRGGLLVADDVGDIVWRVSADAL